VEIIKRGLISGFRQAFLTGAGAMCADATYLTLIFFGLTSFLNNDFIVKFLGVAGSFILMYLGAMSVREYFRKVTAPPAEQRRIFKYSFFAGYTLAISSPMTMVWWTGIFSALIATQGPVKTNLSAFLSCLCILLGCFLWVFSLAVTLHWGRNMLSEKITRVISLIAGFFLFGFGAFFFYRTWTLIKT
jgi:threonine/homoserine/homoserine lactone efflux protein